MVLPEFAPVTEGTAKNKYDDLEKFKVTAKTGTAQTGRNSAAHLWFAGFWTDRGETYSFAICLLNANKHIKRDGEETNSAAAFSDVLRKYYKIEKKKPKEENKLPE